MLRLLLLSLILTATTVTSNDLEGSADGDDEGDDELEERTSSGTGFLKNEGKDQSISDEDGTNTIIIIAAVSVVALAIVAVIAIVLFRHHLQNREQGVYTVPAEQGQKVAA